jgi:hypothetical protein
LNIKQKLLLALTGYAGLGLLAWLTLSDEPIQVMYFQARLRTCTLVILGLFAFRSLLYFYRTRIEEADEKRRGAPQ